MWGWITTNISPIKDILWIIFTFVATLIAILTYRRAKFTLLQPLRTEVVKRQTEVLVNVLEFFDSSFLFSFKLDYMCVVYLNMYMLLKEYGFVLNYEDKNCIDKNLAGALFAKQFGTISSIEKIELFQEKTETEQREKQLEESKQKYESAKSGNVDIDVIYVTKNFMICEKQMQEFINNPFIPEKVKKLLENIKRDINYNLTSVLKNVLEEFMIEICSSKYHFDKEHPLNIHGDALYNSFNKKSNNNNFEIEKIREIVREYLMVDKKWS